MTSIVQNLTLVNRPHYNVGHAQMLPDQSEINYIVFYDV